MAQKYIPIVSAQTKGRIISPKVFEEFHTSKKPTNYFVAGQTRKIPVNFFGQTVYSSNLLTRGNAKLDNQIMIWDMLAVYTCGNCSDCTHFCYAKSDQNQYPDVFNKRNINTYIAKYNLPYFEELVCRQLSRARNRKYVRIHSSGDFFSQEYIQTWERIAAKFPDTKFYFYTKMAELLDFSTFANMENVNMVNSMINGKVNVGSREYIEQLADESGAKICPYGYTGTRPVPAVAKCGACDICMNNPLVVFELREK